MDERPIRVPLTISFFFSVCSSTLYSSESFLGASMGVLVIVFLILLAMAALMLKWNEIRYRRKGLPPGTMGWPVFGETLEFLKQGPDFMKHKRTRYGNVFKSHIFGCPTVISMDVELNRHILLNEAKGLVPGYPPSALDILGKCNIAAVQGSTHKHMRGSMLSLISPPMIKHHLLPKIDLCMRYHLRDWDAKIINIQEKTNRMTLFIDFNLVVGTGSSSTYEAFTAEFDKLLAGSLSLPIKLPGTNYYRGLKGRENIIRTLSEMINKRRTSSMAHDDMLGALLDKESSKYKLSDEEIYDQIITILNSGLETVSTTSMMAIKYLHDHPKALKELREEHFMIREGKTPEQPLDWDDYRSMKFTRAVIFETMRLASVVNGVLRKTTKDIELNGLVFPGGWRIYVYTREINYDPFLYPEPLTFNPWRWLEDKSLETQHCCFLFGGGTRLCPGKELGIVTISVFLHYFVTKYRWEELGGQKIVPFPRVEAPDGLHIRVMKY